eukprot:727055-Ditylum_brightwellii.AAC.1
MMHTPRKVGASGYSKPVSSPTLITTLSPIVQTNENGEVLTWSSHSPHVMNAMSNIKTEAEMGTYISVEDPKFHTAAGDKEDLTDVVSLLSMNDNISHGSQ